MAERSWPECDQVRGGTVEQLALAHKQAEAAAAEHGGVIADRRGCSPSSWIMAPLPSVPVERGGPAPDCIDLLVSKFADHPPLYRPSGTEASDRVDLLV